MLPIVWKGENVSVETISELKKILKQNTDDKTFAEVYCFVSNTFYDFEIIGGDTKAKAGEPYAIPRKEFKKWNYFYDELFRELKKRMEKNNITETYENKCPVGHAFLAKYGYHHFNRWVNENELEGSDYANCESLPD